MNRGLTIVMALLVLFISLLIVWKGIACGTSSHLPSCLALWGDFVSGAGTLIAVGVAVWAGLQWRVQQLTEFEARWAFELIDKLKRVESAFQWRRRRVVFEGETDEMKQREINDALREFLLAARPLEDVWGDPFKANVIKIERQIVRLEVSVRSYHEELERKDRDLKRQRNGGQPKFPEFDEDRLDQLIPVALAPISHGDSDPFGREFETVTNAVRKELLAKMRHLGRISR